jgi:DNA-binding phage protein
MNTNLEEITHHAYLVLCVFLIGYLAIIIEQVIKLNKAATGLLTRMDVGRESLYKSLSEKGKPRFSTIVHALKACGLGIGIHPVNP